MSIDEVIPSLWRAGTWRLRRRKSRPPGAVQVRVFWFSTKAQRYIKEYPKVAQTLGTVSKLPAWEYHGTTKSAIP